MHYCWKVEDRLPLTILRTGMVLQSSSPRFIFGFRISKKLLSKRTRQIKNDKNVERVKNDNCFFYNCKVTVSMKRAWKWWFFFWTEIELSKKKHYGKPPKSTNCWKLWLNGTKCATMLIIVIAPCRENCFGWKGQKSFFSLSDSCLDIELA